MSQSQATSSSIPAHTTCGHAVELDITLEPLVVACLAALNQADKPGSGLKVLRLVNKHMNQALLRKIQGYTLVLDGKPKNLPKTGLLRLTQLKHLRIVVIAGECQTMHWHT